ncbi:MAG TPA: phosphate ABC transporter permease subunit PstC [Solirubrobacteraceae bacterium]|nr:phosphate ABC transporter permease subunit PstC [Solirubrobacteraceae bacterium]
MSVRANLTPRRASAPRARLEGSIGDRVMRGLCALGALIAVVTLADVVYQVINGATPAISKLGLGFLVHSEWAPNLRHFGALPMLFGTGAVAMVALIIATPVSLAIALYLAMLAPRPVRVVVGPLVELLAAIPSVILGLWGIIIFAPLVQRIEPSLHGTLGFLALFGAGQSTGLSIFSAGVLVTVMVIPIIASLSRDLFLSVPRELIDGAEALGATRWEVIRGIVLPTTFSGMTAAVMLGLGRALGEAIAVASVIGGATAPVQASLFQPGNTLAARITIEIGYIENQLQQASLFYLALILLAISLAVNLLARWIARRYDVHRTFV